MRAKGGEEQMFGLLKHTLFKVNKRNTRKNLKVWKPATLFKETPSQVFSCEYFEMLKNNFFYRKPPGAKSEGLETIETLKSPWV